MGAMYLHIGQATLSHAQQRWVWTQLDEDVTARLAEDSSWSQQNAPAAEYEFANSANQ